MSDRTVVLEASEFQAFAVFLKHHYTSASGRIVASKIERILDHLDDHGTVTIERLRPPALEEGAGVQPVNVTPEQTIFPNEFPDGFGQCPISFVFSQGRLRRHLIGLGHTILDDLSSVRVGDLDVLEISVIKEVEEVRRRVTRLLIEKPVPRLGYRPIPSALTPERSAKSVMAVVADYLPEPDRTILRYAFNIEGTDRTLLEVAKTTGFNGPRPGNVVSGTLGMIAYHHDWWPSYDYLVSGNAAVSDKWLAGIQPKLRRNFEFILKKAKDGAAVPQPEDISPDAEMRSRVTERGIWPWVLLRQRSRHEVAAGCAKLETP